MTKSKEKAEVEFILPSNVVTKGDMARLVIDLERVDNEMTAADVRKKAGSKTVKRPVLSDELEAFLDENDLDLDESNERSVLIKKVRKLKNDVPVVHMTFATVADPASLQKLVEWFRDSVHPQIVIEAGLQPSLVGGVYVRTPNHVHDFSLKGILQGRRDLLATELRGLRGAN